MAEIPTLILQGKLTVLITESFFSNLPQKQDQTKIVTMNSRGEIFDTTCRRWNKTVSIKMLVFSSVHLSNVLCDNTTDNKCHLLKIELGG